MNPTNPVTAPQPAAAAAASVPIIPNPWEGGFGLFKHSKVAMRKNVGTYVALYVIYLVVYLAFAFALPRLANLFNLFVGTVFAIAYTRIFLASVYDQKVSFSQVIKISPSLFFKFLGMEIIMGLAIAFGFILLIVPAFFVIPRVALAPYFMLDAGLGPKAAVEASWAAMKGHGKKYWGIIGVSFVVALLTITIIGIPFVIWYELMFSAATAILYVYLKGVVPAPAPAAPAVAATATAPTPPVPAA